MAETADIERKNKIITLELKLSLNTTESETRQKQERRRPPAAQASQICRRQKKGGEIFREERCASFQKKNGQLGTGFL